MKYKNRLTITAFALIMALTICSSALAFEPDSFEHNLQGSDDIAIDINSEEPTISVKSGVQVKKMYYETRIFQGGMGSSMPDSYVVQFWEDGLFWSGRIQRNGSPTFLYGNTWEQSYYGYVYSTI